jgi:hypothetical protein
VSHSQELIPPEELRDRPAEPALAAYRQRNRRAMRIYAAVLVAVVVLAVIAVRLAYAHGELVHVAGHSAPAPVPIPAAATADSVELRWRSSDHPAGGNPESAGVVVTYDSHSVHGRDARTGAVRWYYTRTDETICSVLQQDASTIAVYNRHGNCDEVTGLVTATGATKWFRTLTDNGLTVAASAPNVVLLVADYSVHVIDNAGGLDRWNWVAPDRCSVRRALAGSQGVLISTRCGSVSKLVLRGLTTDNEKWTVTVPAEMVPVAASTFIGAVDPSTGLLHSYSPDKGVDTTVGQLATPAELRAPLARLSRAATAADGSTSAGQNLEFSWLGRLYSFAGSDLGRGSIRWSQPAAGPASVTDSDAIAAISSTAVRRYTGVSGHIDTTVALSPALTGEYRPSPVGSGLLMAGSDTLMYQ